MLRSHFVGLSLMCAVGLGWPAAAVAQPLGSFRWQLQPYCNVVTLTVVQNGGVFTLDGFDDQCGATTRAPVTGTAVPNPNGTIAIGLNIVSSPGAAPVHVAVPLSVATLGGTWQDSAGGSGNFVFTPGAGTGGAPRPVASSEAIPPTIKLFPEGGFVAGGALNVGPIPATGEGARMMWYPGKASFRVGQATTDAWNDLNIGVRSAAFGLNTIATGLNSVAFGHNTYATAENSAAFGFDSRASGSYAFAQGYSTEAEGVASAAFGSDSMASGTNALAGGNATSALGLNAVAFGSQTIASGTNAFAMGAESAATAANSTAMGFLARAEGGTSVAMGSRVTASGAGSIVLGSDAVALPAANGAIILSDRSSLNKFTGFAPNEFLVRAAGGSGIYSNAALTSGVELPANGSAWLSVSDVNMKENFRDLDQADMLAKIARMPIREWNYKAQDAAIRHVGPTAQDFHAAFGLGENPLRISTIDADGIALAAVKALEARTQALADENRALRERLDALERLIGNR